MLKYSLANKKTKKRHLATQRLPTEDWSDCVDTQVDLSLLWVYKPNMPIVWHWPFLRDDALQKIVLPI